MTTLSYEVFPPNSTVGINHLNQVLTSLRDLSPDFISVTCNSNTKQLAHETVRVADYVENDCQVPAMAHLLLGISAGKTLIESWNNCGYAMLIGYWCCGAMNDQNWKRKLTLPMLVT